MRRTVSFRTQQITERSAQRSNGSVHSSEEADASLPSTALPSDCAELDPRRALLRSAVRSRNWDTVSRIIADPTMPTTLFAKEMYKTARSLLYSHQPSHPDEKTDLLANLARRLLSRPDRFQRPPDVAPRIESAKIGRGKLKSDGPPKATARSVVALVEDLVDCLFRLNTPRARLEAARILDSILEQSPSAISRAGLTSALDTLASHHRPQWVHRLISRIPYERRTLLHYKAGLTLMQRRGHEEVKRTALEIWDELTHHPFVRPDNEAFHLYLALKAREGQVTDVTEAVGRMERLGLLPDPKVPHFVLQAWTAAAPLPSAGSNLPATTVEANILLTKAGLGRNGATGFFNALKELRDQGTLFDEVTRNLVARIILQADPPSSPTEVRAFLREALQGYSHHALSLSDFNRFRQPLYMTVAKAMERVGTSKDKAEVQAELTRHKQMARLFTETLEAVGDPKTATAPWGTRLRPIDDFFFARPPFTRAHLQALEEAVRAMPDGQKQDGSTAREETLKALHAAAAMADDRPG